VAFGILGVALLIHRYVLVPATAELEVRFEVEQSDAVTVSGTCEKRYHVAVRRRMDKPGWRASPTVRMTNRTDKYLVYDDIRLQWIDESGNVELESRYLDSIEENAASGNILTLLRQIEPHETVTLTFGLARLEGGAGTKRMLCRLSFVGLERLDERPPLDGITDLLDEKSRERKER
jgi:hypothetical protein